MPEHSLPPPGVRTPDPMLGRRGQRKAPLERAQSAPPQHHKADVDPPTKPKRQRVVLSGGGAPQYTPALRGRIELAQQTSWGETLIKDLIAALLRWCGVFVAFAVLLIAGLPALIWSVPDLAAARLAGVPVAWLLLGVLPFPLLFGIGFAYQRVAERHERAFVDMIEN